MHQDAIEPRSTPTPLGRKSICRLLLFTHPPTITIYYYYSAQKLVLILVFHEGCKAEST